MKTTIEVFIKETDEVVRTVDVTGKSQACIKRIEAGLTRNMGLAFDTRVVTQ